MKIKARRYHRSVWMVLGLLLPVIAVSALLLKQKAPDGREPVILEAPKDG